MTQTQQSDWKLGSWIINKFENKILWFWLWISQNLYLVLGYSRKYPPPPPMDDTELGTQKFQDFQERQQQFMQDCKLWWFKFLGNSRILQDFKWFFRNSGQNSQNFGKIRGIPVRLTEHFLQDFQCRPWGCVDTFWNSPLLRIVETSFMPLLYGNSFIKRAAPFSSCRHFTRK